MKDCNGCGGSGWNSAGENKIGVYPCAICGGTGEQISLHDGRSKRPYAQPEAGRKNVYMDRDTLKRLKDIGDGNVSAGIRIAVKAYKGTEVK